MKKENEILKVRIAELEAKLATATRLGGQMLQNIHQMEREKVLREAEVAELRRALDRVRQQYVPDHSADIDLAECHRIAEQALDTDVGRDILAVVGAARKAALVWRDALEHDIPGMRVLDRPEDQDTFIALERALKKYDEIS